MFCCRCRYLFYFITSLFLGSVVPPPQRHPPTSVLLSITSEGVGKGSSFVLQLPMTRDPHHQTPAQAQAHPSMEHTQAQAQAPARVSRQFDVIDRVTAALGAAGRRSMTALGHAPGLASLRQQSSLRRQNSLHAGEGLGAGLSTTQVRETGAGSEVRGGEHGATRPAVTPAVRSSGTAIVPASAWVLGGGESKGSSLRQGDAAPPPNIAEMETTDAADFNAIVSGAVAATAATVITTAGTIIPTVTRSLAIHAPPGSSARTMLHPQLATVLEEDAAALRSGAVSSRVSESGRGSGSESGSGSGLGLGLRQGPGPDAGAGAGAGAVPQGSGLGPTFQRPGQSMTTPTFAQESMTRSRNVDDVEANHMFPSGAGVPRRGSVDSRGSARDGGMGSSVKGRNMIRALYQQSSDSLNAPISAPAPAAGLAPVPAL